MAFSILGSETVQSDIRQPLGEILCENGTLDRAALKSALNTQQQVDLPLGQVLMGHGRLDGSTLSSALARQSGLPRIQLGDAAPLADFLTLSQMLRLTCLPLEETPTTRHIAIADPRVMPELRAMFPACQVVFSLMDEDELHGFIQRRFPEELAYHAAHTCPDAFSCRGWGGRMSETRLTAGVLWVLAFGIWFPHSALMLLLAWVIAMNTATSFLRVMAIATQLRLPKIWRRVERALPPPDSRLPRVSILLPCLHEGMYLRHLIEAVDAMDYPSVAKDVILLVEQRDRQTLETLGKLAPLPMGFRVLVVPEGHVQTKPRAMNYALPFCKGDIVGIYDAEDRPEPQQLRKMARAFRSSPPDVACVQAALDFYNTRQNWLTRCFFIEYATWFRVILYGLQVLRLPLPLGGTSLFIRKNVLEEVGAWDAHNVTEDADLGVRLSRFGYRSVLIRSVTYEEANPVMKGWVKQRSRWLKGYIVTWITHMQNPRSLIKDIGWKGFWALHVLFLGGMTGYLAIPFFWALSFTTVALETPQWWNALPQAIKIGFWVSMPLGQVVMVSAMVLAVTRTQHRNLWPWVLTMPFYWPIGAAASYLAMYEVFAKPFHWHKTAHGLSKENA